VARCIVREIKAGRGSPHGGVFLDISWIKAKISNSEEHIKRKLPSMYHQFKQLADIDITKEPMEVGPTTHYVMGGVHVNADTQMSTVPGLFAAGECASGINGANRLGGNSLSDLLVFGKRAGEYAAAFAKEHQAGRIQESELDGLAKQTLEPFDRGDASEGPYRIQYDLQALMQDNVGIVRSEAEMQHALEALAGLRARAARVGVGGNREYNNGWHTALDLENLLTVSEAVARSAITRKESRGGHFRDDYPKQDPAFSTINVAVRRQADGSMQVTTIPIPPMPAELKQVIEENK
jgi:succinate dehydrogenase / fumarate reductase, flavoprotein subunit